MVNLFTLLSGKEESDNEEDFEEEMDLFSLNNDGGEERMRLCVCFREGRIEAVVGDGHLRVFPGEACSSQHKLLALDTLFVRKLTRRVASRLLRILWKNLNGEAAEAFRVKASEGLSTQSEDLTASDADQMWNTMAGIIREAAKDSLGVASGAARNQQHNRESWWFSEEVQAKRASFMPRGLRS
ncbi:hypothetical protein CTI12_AA224070 [Artemisia annua]|uniref:Uncharacterized protein n=1 Tax=Artemisia annua TaxID=35608 RepID=A0A2U1NRI6_ARTAN|nr:hypothetical protein CTI12_AA224070 [Artemisia annua]